MERMTGRSVALLALLAIAAFAAPSLAESTTLRLIARIAILGLLALSVNLALGVTGLPTLAGGLFFGVGGYCVALASLHLNYDAVPMLIAAPFAAAAVAAVSGLFVFRAKELYFALITLALAQAMFVVVVQWYSVTQGDDGIHGVNVPTWLGPIEARYRLAIAVVFVAALSMQVIIASPFGAALKAIRQNRDRVRFLGLRPRGYEYAAWVLSAMYAAIAGGLMVIVDQSATPDVFHWSFSTVPLLMCIIGGTAYFFGPLAGAAFAELVQEYARSWSGRTSLMYGVAVLLIAISRRDGIIGITRDAATRVGSAFLRARQPDGARHDVVESPDAL